MVEIVLHRVPGAKVEAERTAGPVAVLEPLFNAIPPEGGITPEALFGVVMEGAGDEIRSLLPHQFFLAIVGLMDGGFVSASVRKVASA